MKRQSVNYLIVGAAVLLALALLLAVLNRITGAAGATDRYYAHYERVAGLKFGTPVYFEGFRVGQVREVVPEHDGLDTRFRVALDIARGWPLPADSVAEAASAGLLSDVFIYIHEGSSGEALEPGARIASREAADLFAAISALAGEAQRLAEGEIAPMLELFSERLDDITAPLQAGTPEIVEQLRGLLARLSESAASLQAALGRDNQERFQRVLGNLERSTGSAAALADELRASRERLDALLADAGALVADNRPELTRMVESLELTLERLDARLDSITYNLDEASRNFNEFARAIRRSPNRIIFSPGSEAAGGEDVEGR